MILNAGLISIVLLIGLFKQTVIIKCFSALCWGSLLYVSAILLIETPSIFDGKNLKMFQLTGRIADSTALTLYSFHAIFTVPLAYNEFKRSSHRTLEGMKYSQLVFSLFLFSLLFVFSCYNNAAKGKNDVTLWLLLIAKLLFIAILNVSTAINLHQLANSVIELIPSINHTPSSYLLTKVMISVKIGIFAYFFSIPETYYKVIGGSAVLLFDIILPTMIYWKVSGNYPVLISVSLWSVLLFLLGISSASFALTGLQI